MNPTPHTHDYQICLQGHLDERWLSWFEGLQITPLPQGETLLCGALDQSALHGVLSRIRDLGLELISVQRAPLPAARSLQPTSPIPD